METALSLETVEARLLNQGWQSSDIRRQTLRRLLRLLTTKSGK